MNTIWSEEDNSFIATSMEFPFLSGFGKTPEKATAELWKVIQQAIEILIEDGEKIPDPVIAKEYSGQLRLRMPISLHERLVRASERENVSLNTYILTLLQDRSAKEEVYERVIMQLNGVIGHTYDIAQSVSLISQEQTKFLTYSGEENKPEKEEFYQSEPRNTFLRVTN